MDIFDSTESENFNAKEIAEEREHLDLVLYQIKEQIALLEDDGFAYRIVDIYDENDVEEYRTDKFRHDARLRDIEILKASLSTPYFARMKLRQKKFVGRCDAPSMTRARLLTESSDIGVDPDIYVGANVIFHRGKIIVYSHNSPLGNKVYERFENGKISYGGYEYEVVFRRKFDIRGGKLMAMFQDYSEESGGVVYDKFLAHMLEIKRGDKRLTDIIPTIQSNQNSIITRPAAENCVVRGCAGCGKTMILLHRLEYLGFNKKLELSDALVITPGGRYNEHIQPVVDDLMINAARRISMGELYKELILFFRGIKSSERKKISDLTPFGDDELSDKVAIECYGDGLKKKLITSLAPVKRTYNEKLKVYRDELTRYEAESVWSPDAVKPHAPAVTVSLDKFPFIPPLPANCKARLYLLLTAYCYILGKPDFKSTLFIDEGQDYFLNEYRLLKDVTRVTVNVYGDENQQLVRGRGIDDFGLLSGLWKDMQYYALNENYRNSREITSYVNSELNMNVTSLGLEGGKVRKASIDEFYSEIKSSSGDDRIAVIYSSRDKNACRALEGVPKDILYTVSQAKGMEYERVYALGDLSGAEKYVAYTRALEELCIVDL